jgi:hypothetical protein
LQVIKAAVAHINELEATLAWPEKNGGMSEHGNDRDVALE